MSIHIYQRELVGPEFFLFGDGAILFRNKLALLPVTSQGSLDVNDTSALVPPIINSVNLHPRQREDQESWER